MTCTVEATCAKCGLTVTAGVIPDGTKRVSVNFPEFKTRCLARNSASYPFGKCPNLDAAMRMAALVH